MKKKIVRWINSIAEVSIKVAVNDFFDGDWDPTDWEKTEEYIDAYIEEEISEITDEEERCLRAEIEKEYNRRVLKLKQKEIDKLKDRESILEVLEGLTSDWCDEGDVGYILSKEEILDLIIKNGNK